MRRVLGKLWDAGIPISEKGQGGDWRLAQGPESITLADVCRTLDERLTASMTEDDQPPCSIEHALRRRVVRVMDEIEQSLIERLGETTISEVHGM